MQYAERHAILRLLISACIIKCQIFPLLPSLTPSPAPTDPAPDAPTPTDLPPTPTPPLDVDKPTLCAHIEGSSLPLSKLAAQIAALSNGLLDEATARAAVRGVAKRQLLSGQDVRGMEGGMQEEREGEGWYWR